MQATIALIFAGLYLFFAGQTSAEEDVAALVSAGLAVWWWRKTENVCERHFTFSAAALWTIVRAFADLPSSFAHVFVALIRSKEGSAEAIAFIYGRRESPDDAVRRAASVLALSLSPDKFVVRLRPERNELVVHTIVRLKENGDARWPA